MKNLAPKDEAKVKAGYVSRKAGGSQHDYLTVTVTDVF